MPIFNVPRRHYELSKFDGASLDDDDMRLHSAQIVMAAVANPDAEVFVGLSANEKRFLILTSAARIIERDICEANDFDRDDALDDLDALVGTMRREIIERCLEHADAV